MAFTKEQQRYIELIALDRVFNSYANVAEALGNKALEKQIQAEYSKKGGIKEWLADELFGKDDKDKFSKIERLENDKELEKEKEKIDNIFSNQYSSNTERKKGFGSFKAFYNHLFSNGRAKCYYCGTTQDELNHLFGKELIKSSKFTATLHIEQKRAKQGYAPQNCVLACSLCNNAKSDMISAENFKGYFGEPIRKFISDLLNGKITNQI